MNIQDDRFFMQRARTLARRGAGKVSPNPLVGAVLVKNGKIIAEGWHHSFGSAHAEADLLNRARRKKINTKNTTLYVTLEPCCHTDKKTPPCVPALIQAGIKRVFIAHPDPNPLVNGKGIKQLRAAGTEVNLGVLAYEVHLQNIVYIKWMKSGMPFVSMKVAMTLDGAIATKTGDSKWITGPQARKYVKSALRDHHDAILVGKGTVVADNPTLTGTRNEPMRIVLDSKLSSPIHSAVFRNAHVIVATTKKAPARAIADLKEKDICLKVFPETINLASLLRFVGGKSVSSLLVEGGSRVFGSFMDAELVDRVYFFIAPKIVGGVGALRAVGGKGVSALKSAHQLQESKVNKIGDDLLITGIMPDSYARWFRACECA